MTKHTPSPWIIEPHHPGTRGHWLRSSDNELLALACKMDGGPDVELANARLIRVSPDLLASLRAILPYAESRAEDMLEADGEADGCDPSPETQKAVAAVDAAKALLASLEV